jgi:carbamoyl-phosphate synthase large subunit
MSAFNRFSDGLVVGVTGINASDNPAPGLGVAKSLKLAGAPGIQVVGLAYDAMEPGIYLDDVIDHAFMIPFPSACQQALVERLLYIKQQVGLDVLIPNLDSEIPVYIRAQETLARQGIHCLLPTREQFELRDKRRLAAFATSAGLHAPRQRLVADRDGLKQAAAHLGYPLMVKGSLYGAYCCADLGEALAAFASVLTAWGSPVIVQQRIEGEAMNIVGVGDGRGEAPGMIAVRKMTTTRLGKIWTGITVDNPSLMSAAADFLSVSRWRGAFELECILGSAGVSLIEINPRFPAWVYFAAGVGSNLPLALVRRALGDDAPEPSPFKDGYPSGRLYIRYTDERVCDMRVLQNMTIRGESARGEFL